MISRKVLDRCTTLMVLSLKESGRMTVWLQSHKWKFNLNMMKTVSYLFQAIIKDILDTNSITSLNLSMEKNYLNILCTLNLKDLFWNQQLNIW